LLSYCCVAAITALRAVSGYRIGFQRIDLIPVVCVETRHMQAVLKSGNSMERVVPWEILDACLRQRRVILVE
jgi:hypothetical protein